MVKRALLSSWAPAIAVIIVLTVHLIQMGSIWGVQHAQQERLIDDVRALSALATEVVVAKQRLTALEVWQQQHEQRHLSGAIHP